MKNKNRREFILHSAMLLGAFGLVPMLGCRGISKGRVKSAGEKDRVGGTALGAEGTGTLIHGSVCNLLGQVESQPIQQATYNSGQYPVRRICFVGLENRGAEEMTDTKLYVEEQLRTHIGSYPGFDVVNSWALESGLRECRLQPQELFEPRKMAQFSQVMGQQGQVVDYLLRATLTTQTTEQHIDSQRDYLLTLELVDVNSLSTVARAQQKISKDYNRSAKSKFTGFFKR